jgi:hypothetical protein
MYYLKFSNIIFNRYNLNITKFPTMPALTLAIYTIHLNFIMKVKIQLK